MSDSAFLPRPRAGRITAKMAGLLLPGMLLFGASSAWADHLEKRFKVEARPVVTIHNPDGRISVKAWTKRQVQVQADHDSPNIEVDAVQTGNRIDILTRQLSDTAAPGDWRADYEIRVPEDAELQIHNDTGGVSVNDVLGDMNVETIEASVNLEDTAGYLTIKTIGGSFECVRCAGRLEVSSISGSFRFTDLHSYQVTARTWKGDIYFNGEFLPNGTYSLKNHSGLIEVRFSPGDSFDLSATSLKGRVQNEAKLMQTPNQAFFVPRVGESSFGTFNAGHAKVELTSFDGTISILKRE